MLSLWAQFVTGVRWHAHCCLPTLAAGAVLGLDGMNSLTVRS
jgi:hypothetical protein